MRPEAEAVEAFIQNADPYSMLQSDKEAWMLRQMKTMVAWHEVGCSEYANFVRGGGYKETIGNANQLEELPYLPTAIFKRLVLRTSQAPEATTHWKAVQSSSTSSGTPSQIFVDEATSLRQKTSVQMIFNSYLGPERRPYIIFDAMETARGKSSMSARGAAIMSLMGYASQFFFVMDLRDGQLVLNEEKLAQAVQAAREAGNFIAYGFTYILYQAHEQLKARGLSFDGFGERSYLIHSGGWKKLQSMAVGKEAFNQFVSSQWALPASQVIDFYGLVEQTGVIYPDCPFGNKHVPYYADVIVRDSHTLKPLPIGQSGLIQLLYLLPLSSPNHSVITDDLGEITGVDDCPCGRKGKSFRFVGRAPKSEVRGCGDVYAEDHPK